jgi:hypothetical protein
MKGEGYSTMPNADATAYYFDSIGKQGTIRKKVTFFLIFENTWNLGFGDADGDDDFDDMVVSNNYDVRKIMQTLANIIHEFTEEHPLRRVYIRPVDEKRKLLYNAVFHRKHLEVQTSFELFGRFGNKIEAYKPEKTYDAFLIQRRIH